MLSVTRFYSIVRVSAIAAYALAGFSMRAEESVIGKWRSTAVSGIQYQNTTTGAPAPTNGRSFTYDFRADGTYEHTGLMQMVAYNCTTKLWGGDSGRYRVEGNYVVIEPAKGVINTNNNCSGRSTREEKTLGNRKYRYHFENNQGQPVLVMGGDQADSRPDYYKREQ